ncbi:hypothetical protein ZWY2020_030868 [Hordeum vulgare]|nr:hypothetical protein ZWY2020_030868 [Hordeum vulgare]
MDLGGQETNALVLADSLMPENGGTCNVPVDEDTKDFELFPPKAVALHRLRWNMNKGSEKWLCYGGAAGIIRWSSVYIHLHNKLLQHLLLLAATYGTPSRSL